jgi:hypothetical protein
MGTKLDSWKISTGKVKLFLGFIIYMPKIIFSYFSFVIKGKRVHLRSFKANSNYSIQGTLNQLTWDVENAVFITLSNSSKIFFESDEEIFKTRENQNTFKIICYGIRKKEIAIVSIKVVKITMADFEQVSIRNKNKNMVVRFSGIDSELHLIHNKTPKLSSIVCQINGNKLNPEFKEVVSPMIELKKIQNCSSLETLKRVKEGIT